MRRAKRVSTSLIETSQPCLSNKTKRHTGIPISTFLAEITYRKRDRAPAAVPGENAPLAMPSLIFDEQKFSSVTTDAAHRNRV